MQFVGKVVSTVSEFYKEINPATLSGAIDVVVVEGKDGSLACSPFHVRFGKLKLLRPQEKVVDVVVNGNTVPVQMKVGDAGEAFFVIETDTPIPPNMATSPIQAPLDETNELLEDVEPLSLGRAAVGSAGVTTGDAIAATQVTTTGDAVAIRVEVDSKETNKEAALQADSLTEVSAMSVTVEVGVSQEHRFKEVDDGELSPVPVTAVERLEEVQSFSVVKQLEVVEEKEETLQPLDKSDSIPHTSEPDNQAGAESERRLSLPTSDMDDEAALNRMSESLYMPALETVTAQNSPTNVKDAQQAEVVKHLPTPTHSPVSMALNRLEDGTKNEVRDVIHSTAVQSVQSEDIVDEEHFPIMTTPEPSLNAHTHSTDTQEPKTEFKAPASLKSKTESDVTITPVLLHSDNELGIIKDHAINEAVIEEENRLQQVQDNVENTCSIQAPGKSTPLNASTTTLPPTTFLPSSSTAFRRHTRIQSASFPTEEASLHKHHDPSNPLSDTEVEYETTTSISKDKSGTSQSSSWSWRWRWGNLPTQIQDGPEPSPVPSESPDRPVRSRTETDEIATPKASTSRSSSWLSLSSRAQSPPPLQSSSPSTANNTPKAPLEKLDKRTSVQTAATSLNSSNAQTPSSSTSVSIPIAEQYVIPADLTLPSSLPFDIELSLCGMHSMRANSTNENVKLNEDMFDKHKLTHDQFLNNPGLVMDGNLVAKIWVERTRNDENVVTTPNHATETDEIDSKDFVPVYLPYIIIQPHIISLLVFRKPIPQDSLKSLINRYVSASRAETKGKYSFGGLRQWWSRSASTSGSTNMNGVPATPKDLQTSSVNSQIGTPPSSVNVSVSKSTVIEIRSEKERDERELSPIRNVAPSSDEEEVVAGKKVRYAKTLRLNSEQLKSLNLQKGVNTITFSVTTKFQGKQTCSSKIFFWDHEAQVVISDIDGTITKSDALGHLFTMVGKDWTHSGVASLYTNIYKNGYKILYLTSRAIGQANYTREYLKKVEQGQYQLPEGPVIMSPDRLLTAFHREVIQRRPEEFKIACLRDIKRLFGDRNPFYAGFGNRITDALSYRSVDVPVSRIFTINSNGDIKLELLSGYKSSYVKLNDIVDQIFPPINRSIASDYNDFNFWKPSVPEIELDLADFESKTSTSEDLTEDEDITDGEFTEDEDEDEEREVEYAAVVNVEIGAYPYL